MVKPIIFVSSVSRELKSARQLVANTLLALGYEPAWQDIFETSSDDLREMLRKQIDRCSAVVQIVGDAYGAEPPVRDAVFGRVSYTQYEALYARSRNKPVYYLIAEHDLSRDATAETVDAPRDDTNAADAAERRRLQAEYRKGVLTAEQVYYPVHTSQETELSVRRMRDDLSRLRRGFRNWMIGITAALVLVSGGIGWLTWGQQKQVESIVQQTTTIDEARKAQQDLAKSVEHAQKQAAEQIEASAEKTTKAIQAVVENAVKELTNPAVLAERIRREIHTVAEEKIAALPKEDGRGQRIAAIENERDLALNRVDDLIKLIQEGLKEGASPIFQRAADILQTEGTDAALSYLESRRPSALEAARRHAEQAKSVQARADAAKELRNKSLLPLVLEAELLEMKLQWQPALQLREQVAEIAPDWFEARSAIGNLQLLLARFDAAESHLRSSLKLSGNPTQEADACYTLGRLLLLTNGQKEAEPIIRRGLKIAEQLHGPNHPSVTNHLNTLAQLFQATNRHAIAEPLLRRALAISENPGGRPSLDYSQSLNNFSELLWATNRLAEAEPLLRQSLTINEQSHGAVHPSVAVRLSNLAQLLMDSKRLMEAEPLLRRALAIHEQSYGAKHPDVANTLNSLAGLLRRKSLEIPNPRDEAQDRLGPMSRATLLSQAESLLRRALEIDEQSYGAEHPIVAIRLNNVAQVLEDTNRLTEAEALVRRHVMIFHRFGRKTGREHFHMQTALENYRGLLQTMQMPTGEIELRVRSTTETLEPLNPFAPEVERLLGPAQPVADVLAALDRQYRAERRPAVYFLPPNQPIAPHLDELLGPAKSTQKVFEALDRQYRKEGKTKVWFLPLNEPISPHLDELIGLAPQNEQGR